MVTIRINTETTYIVDRVISFILLYKDSFGQLWEGAESIKNTIDVTTSADSKTFKLPQEAYDHLKVCIKTAITYTFQTGETAENYKIGIYGIHFINDKYKLGNVFTPKKNP